MMCMYFLKSPVSKAVMKQKLLYLCFKTLVTNNSWYPYKQTNPYPLPKSSMRKEMGLFAQLCVLKLRDTTKNGFIPSDVAWISFS